MKTRSPGKSCFVSKVCWKSLLLRATSARRNSAKQPFRPHQTPCYVMYRFQSIQFVWAHVKKMLQDLGAIPYIYIYICIWVGLFCTVVAPYPSKKHGHFFWFCHVTVHISHRPLSNVYYYIRRKFYHRIYFVFCVDQKGIL